MDGFLFWFMFSVIVLVVVVVAIVMANVGYFISQQSMGKDADEEE